MLVEQIELNSPADQAGLHGSFKPTVIGGQRLAVGGDVITAIDGQTVSTIEDLQSFVQQASPGLQATLTLLRDGQEIEVTLTLSTRPAPTP